MENYIILAVVAIIIGLATWYVVRAKKRGQKCIGCPGCSAQKNKGCSTCCPCAQNDFQQ